MKAPRHPRAVNGLKRKFKSVLKQFKVELAEMKKTKGQTLPNVQPLLELREWFEARLAALDWIKVSSPCAHVVLLHVRHAFSRLVVHGRDRGQACAHQDHHR